ncbi:MAG: hypothetical protein R3220_11705 [Balneolaceae bacterium]|nr:hypothetical protein [Balneolaceae bacterium]
MNKSRYKVIACTVIAILVLFIAGFSKTQAQTLTGRAVIHLVPDNTRMIQVPEMAGHSFILAHFKGLAFFENGEIAEVMGVETIHSPKGSGSYVGYEVLTFSDGSTIMSQVEGTNKPAKEGKYVQFEATITYLHGTGRFEGIRGSGDLNGRNYVATGAGGYYDFEGTYSVPSD